MSKRVHGNKEAKKPKQVPALPPPVASALTPLPVAGRKPPQARQ